jgi:ribosomal protein S18 acetylase RimI-like enzyme
MSSPSPDVPTIIREATEADWPSIWKMFQEVTEAGDVFAYDSDTTEETARKLWVQLPSRGYVAVRDNQILGTYFIRPNQPGRGSHIANGGYMVSSDARGQGIASMLCGHSLETARQLGFKGIQFNFVICTNTAAIRVWEKHGFREIGRIPKGFLHQSLGYVDAFIMFREL